MNTPLRIVFFGTPEPSKIVLASLIESRHDVVAVVTQPDRRRGRGSAVVSTPVKTLAQQYGIAVYEPENKSEVEEVVVGLSADVGIVVAYGKILTAKVLNAFELGCINVHYSMLPRWRGAAPVERAILEGDSHSGISIMAMDEGLDTGDVYDSREIDITDTTTTTELFDSLNSVAPELLLSVLDRIDDIAASPQVGEATYAHKLSSNDFYFDLITAVDEVDRKVRAASQLKGAWTEIDGEIFRVHQASQKRKLKTLNETGTIDRQGFLTCKDGVLLCERVQVPGKSVMEFSAWANGVAPEKFPLRIAT